MSSYILKDLVYNCSSVIIGENGSIDPEKTHVKQPQIQTQAYDIWTTCSNGGAILVLVMF